MATAADFFSPERFRDRKEAGQRLARELLRYKDQQPLVLALPRGGVPVAFEIAEALQAPLDVLFVRKLGAPGHPELGIGAVIDGDQPQRVLNERVMSLVRPSATYVETEERRQLQIIEQRKRLYRGDRPSEPLEGRMLILVDDGIATGGTVRAALQALARTSAKRIVLAVPVAPTDVLEWLPIPQEDFVCLLSPPDFRAVGLHYVDFSQTTDEEVIELLERARQRFESRSRDRPASDSQ